MNAKASLKRSCTLGSWTSGPICQSVRAEALAREGTVACKLQREIVLLLAWGPAILLQLGHPLVARGIAEHSAFRAERWGRVRRFHRTLSTMLQLCFGTEQESRAAVMRINAIHDRVHGCLAEAEGIFSAGTPYSAHDPTLLSWVQATLLAMNLCVYKIYVGDLSPEERDRYCAEASAMESPLGIPEGRLPRSFSQLRGYMDEMLASGEIVVTEAARILAKEIVYPPTTRVVGTAMWLMRLPSIGLLPPEIRRSYGFRWGARDEIMLRLSARFIRTLLLPLTPGIFRYWPVARGAFHTASPSGITVTDEHCSPGYVDRSVSRQGRR